MEYYFGLPMHEEPEITETAIVTSVKENSAGPTKTKMGVRASGPLEKLGAL